MGPVTNAGVMKQFLQTRGYAELCRIHGSLEQSNSAGCYAISLSRACRDAILPSSLVSAPPWAEAMETLHVCPDWDDQGQPQQLFTVRRSLSNSLLVDEFRLWRETDKQTKKYSRSYGNDLICQVSLENQPLALKGSQRSPTNSRGGSSINVWPFWKRLPKPLWPEVKYSFPFLPKHFRTNQPVLAVVSAPHRNTRLYIIHSVARKSQVPPFYGKDLVLTFLLDPMC